MRPRSTIQLLAALIAMLLLAACGGGAGSSVPAVVQQSEQMWLPGPGVAAKLASAVVERRIRGGEEWLGTHAQRVEAESAGAASFSPEYDTAQPDAADLAFALYGFSLAEGADPREVSLSWEPGTEPVAGTLWLGLSSWEDQAWSWRQPPSVSILPQTTLTSFSDAEGTVLVAVLLLGSDSSVLNWLRLGDNAPPVIDVAYSGDGERAPQSVTFDATPSRDYDGAITEFAWDWDADGVFDQIEIAPSAEMRDYALGGQYPVIVQATDDEGLSTVRMLDLDLREHTDWWCEGGNRRNTKAAMVVGPQETPVDCEWFYETVRDIRCVVIGRDGRLLFRYSDTAIHCVNPDGTESWVMDFTSMGSVKQLVVGPDGDIYTCYYNYGDDESRIIAIHPDKTVKWDEELPHAAGCLGITLDGSMLYGGDDPPHLIAIDPLDGSEDWRTPMEYGQFTRAAVADDGAIYVISYNTATGNYGYLYALERDGSFNWHYGGPPITDPPVIGSDGTVYIGGRSGRLRAFDGAGSELWSFPTEGSEDVNELAIGHYLEEERIYFSCDNEWLYCIMPSGELDWRYRDEERDSRPATPVIGQDDKMYLSHGDAWVYCLKPNKNLKWQYRALWGTNNAAARPVAIDSDGTLYVIHGETYGLGAIRDAAP